MFSVSNFFFQEPSSSGSKMSFSKIKNSGKGTFDGRMMVLEAA